MYKLYNELDVIWVGRLVVVAGLAGRLVGVQVLDDDVVVVVEDVVVDSAVYAHLVRVLKEGVAGALVGWLVGVSRRRVFG